MFSDKNMGLLDKDSSFSEFQEALAKCKLFCDVEKQLIPKYKFFQIKKTQVTSVTNKNRFTLQLIDISAKIFYDDIKAQEEFMSITTSSISHEMRNPLNSILSQCQI